MNGFSGDRKRVLARRPHAVSLAAAAAGLLLAACGGGNSTVTTLSGGGLSGTQTGQEVVLSEPKGSNTTEIVVDYGPVEAFSLGLVNVPFVTVTVCQPGGAPCATIDHVLLDTGSIGLRVLKSAVAGLVLPPVNAAPAAGGATTGVAVECYPFVVGGLWGPVVRGDVQIGGERAEALPLQLIDDSAAPAQAPPQDCIDAADGTLLKSVTTLQAKGVLGVGMISHDCGQACLGPPPPGGFVQYYTCSGGTCAPARVPADEQLQNPVAHFSVNNNGTIIMLPAIPQTGATTVRGRLVMGIGTQANNQLLAQAKVVFVETDPAKTDTYLYAGVTVQGRHYPNAYIDSGSNGIFFDDPTLPRTCVSGTSEPAPWYCPSAVEQRSATITDATGFVAPFDFSVANADQLFSTSNVAFDNLAATPGMGSQSFVLGLPFFYGRSVYTAIWFQPLATQGPWWAF
jgi:hypothetical protein